MLEWVPSHVLANTAPHWSWVPSEPQLGPGGYTLGSGYPLGARVQAMQQGGCCCSWGPWLCPPCPLIKRGPFWGPEHPNLSTQLCPSEGMRRVLEGGKGTGLQIWVWSRWWPQEDFSTPPESTLLSSLGNLVQKGTHCRTFSQCTVLSAMPQRLVSPSWALPLGPDPLSFHLEWPEGKGND